MSEAVILNEVQLTPNGAWLTPLLALVATRIRRAMLSDREKHLIAFLEFAAGEIGGRLLTAEDLDDLDIRLDDALEDRRLMMIAEFGQEPFLATSAESISSSQMADAMSESLGAGGGAGIRELLRRGATYAAAIASVMQRVKSEIAVSVNEIPTNPLHFLTDPTVPADVAASLVGGLRSTVCLLAMAQLVISGRRAEPWLVRGIAERWVNGLQVFTRFLASLPGVNVPESIVPLTERLDLQQLEKAAAAREKMFQEVLADPERAIPPRSGDADA